MASASEHAVPPPPSESARLLLIEPAASPYFPRIVQAARETKLPVERLDAPTNSPDDVIVGIGPSVADPLQVARDARRLGSRGLLAFFTASGPARDALHAELVRDPFVAERYELIDMTGDRHQLANRIKQVEARVEQTRGDRRRRRMAARAHPVGRMPSGATSPSGDPHLASILAQAHDAIWSTDEAGQVSSWNAAAERLFLLPAEEALRKPLDALDTPGEPEAPQLSEICHRTLESGLSEQATVICRRGDGATVDVDVSVAPMQDAHGHLQGLSIIARDNTARRAAEAALLDANRQKDEFLAIMSHELRTPLTSILGYTDMLLRGLGGPLEQRTTRYVSNVRSAGDRLLDLVNGLLDFTRLESGAERLDFGSVPFADLVRRVVERCRGSAETKRISLDVDVDDSVGEIRADEEKVQQVLRSYLGNAIKFTPDGGKVRVALNVDPEHASMARVTVADSGIGMRGEQIAHVWERFYQGDASLTRPYGGMGLGLSIARHLILLHGGDVGAESRGPNLGSTFWFRLPRQRQD